MPGSSHLETMIGQNGRIASTHKVDLDNTQATGNVASTVIFTTPKAPSAGTIWLAIWSISQTVINGATGTGSWNLIWNDPDQAADVTRAVLSRVVTANGEFMGIYAFKATANTDVRYSVTGITGAPTTKQRLQFLRLR
jgi:hypothetical protein